MMPEYLINSAQFTICMSASTDALLTNLGFFQLLRQSEDPWVTFNLHPEPVLRLALIDSPSCCVACEQLVPRELVLGQRGAY